MKDFAYGFVAFTIVRFTTKSHCIRQAQTNDDLRKRISTF